MFYGFPVILVDALVCQKSCNGRLRVKADIMCVDGMIVDGVLFCDACGCDYKIESGILNLLSAQPELDIIMQEEIKARDKEASKYDDALAPRYEKEVLSTLKQIGDVKNKKIVEFACGTGRITIEILTKGATVLAVDFSHNSLKILSEKINNKNIGLIQADVTRLKLSADFFDVVFSAQFYEHIPTVERRKNFLNNVNNTIKDDGRFVLTVYHHDLRRRINKMPQEGKHISGIFFHYYTAKELKSNVKDNFDILDLRAIDITLPFEARFNLNKKLKGFISVVLENIPIFFLFGHLLLLKAKKKLSVSVLSGVKIKKIFGIFFKKCWIWFHNPEDVDGVDMINFFSYEDVDIEGFHKKEGLTTVIDLQSSFEDIRSRMRKNFISKQIKKGEKNGVMVKIDNNFNKFKNIYKQFRKNKKIDAGSFYFYKKYGLLFSAYFEGRMIAGGIFMIGNGCVRAGILASIRLCNLNGKMREVVGQANRMVIWEAIKFFKKEGMLMFDLGGIDPNSQDSGQRSLAEFKEAFGGKRKKCYFYFKVYSTLLKLIMRLKGYKKV